MRSQSVGPALLWLGLLCARLTAGRDVVNFDFGWRYSPASASPRAMQCRYESGVNYGRGFFWQGPVASKEECCAECANRPTCRAWDFNGRSCYVKDNDQPRLIQPGRWSGTLGGVSNLSMPVQAERTFKDDDWLVVDTPHDMALGRQSHCLKNGLAAAAVAAVNNCSGWYRKHFSVPGEWAGDAIYVYFGGIFRNSAVWVNGVPLGAHVSGYTSFARRLDPHIQFGNGSVNVLAVLANADPGTGYWFQGGGLTRHQQLIHTGPVFLPPDRAWVHAELKNSSVMPNGPSPAAGQAATGVQLVAQGVVASIASRQARAWVRAEFIEPSTGRLVGSAVSAPVTVPPSGQATFVLKASPAGAMQMWSVARPWLYQASLSLVLDSPAAVDAQNITFGVRDIRLDPNSGLWLNGQHVKMRGFCDHSSFGGVGAAVPERVNLYRAQAIRTAGGNAWRMAVWAVAAM